MCLTDNELIRLVAGEVTAQERDALMAHLQTCQVCRSRQEQLAATWDTLGTWTVSPPEPDLAMSVLAAARRRPSARGWASAAAAVLLATGAGTLAALLLPPHYSESARQDVPTQEAVEAVGLDLLADNTVFSSLFLSDVPGFMQNEEGLP